MSGSSRNGLVGLGGLIAVAMTLLVMPAAAAASPEKTSSASFESEALFGPGTLNLSGIGRVGLTMTGPEHAASGAEVDFHGSTVSVSLPAGWGTELASAGGSELRGDIACVLLDTTNMEPSTFNLAKSGGFSAGLPFSAAVESEKPITFSAPMGSSVFFGEKITGRAGEEATLSTAPGAILAPHAPPVECRRPRTEPPEEDTTGVAVRGETSLYNHTGERILGPIPLEVSNVETPIASIAITGPSERLAFNGWTLAGSLTDKKLGQPITLPTGSTFNGSGELNTETGAGSVTGKLEVPAFTTTLRLFGLLPVTFGMSVSEAGLLQGTIAKSVGTAGDELLTIPLGLNLGINSVQVLGLTISTRCETSEPVALALSDTLTHEELAAKGWSFSGSSTLPRFKCEGGFLSRPFGAILSALLSGPENSYALAVTAPGG
jgi:hypothetical protein